MANLTDIIQWTDNSLPSLSDPNFATAFNDFVDDVKNNFNTIVSAPYLKGDRGNCVESYTITGVHDDNSESDEHKALKEEIIKLLDDTFSPNATQTQIDNGDYRFQDSNGHYYSVLRCDKDNIVPVPESIQLKMHMVSTTTTFFLLVTYYIRIS